MSPPPPSIPRAPGGVQPLEMLVFRGKRDGDPSLSRQDF